MRNLCYICAAALIIVGAVGYFGWEAIGASKQSATALISAFVGVPMLLGGLVAMKNNMAGMHIAVLFSALGALAGLGRFRCQKLEIVIAIVAHRHPCPSPCSAHSPPCVTQR